MTQGLPFSLLGGPSPFKFPTIWDSVSFGGGSFTWSGKIQFRMARRHFSWQHKSGPGKKGTIDTYRGTHTRPFEMILFVWTEDQWNLLPGLLNFFNYDGTKLGPDGAPLVNPIDIYHPSLSFIDIHQVLCEWIEAPEIRQEREGDAIVKFGLHEYLPPLPVNVTKTPVSVFVPTPFTNNLNQGISGDIANQQTAIENLGVQLGEKGSLP